MGVDYDYGSKLVGMVTLVVGLMLCPFLHLLRLRSKVLRRESSYWFNKLSTPGTDSLRKERVKTFLIKKLKVKKDDVEDMIEEVDTNDNIGLPEFAECMTQGRDHRTQDIRALVVRDVMLVILLFHPFVSGLAMKAWKCTSVKSSNSDQPIQYLATDMTIQCFTSYWTGIAVFSGFTIVLFSLGMPAVLFHTLARRRDQLGERDTYKSLGILYGEYRPKHYYFESVELIFKLLLWAAVVASTEKQIQNAVVVSLLIIFVMVRVGARPSIKRWKDKAEVCALGFSLTLKLHDMVHSYLTASKKSSIDEEQERVWQDFIDQSDSFLVVLFVSLAVFIALRGIMIVVDSDQFKGVLRSLMKKRACRRCLLRMCCGCKGKCCRLFCRDLADGEDGRDGTVDGRRTMPAATGAQEVYRQSSIKRIRSRSSAGSAGASRSGESREKYRDRETMGTIEMSQLGSSESPGVNRGGSSVAPVSDPVILRCVSPNPMYVTGRDNTNQGTSNGPRTGTAPATSPRRHKRKNEQNAYSKAHKEDLERRQAGNTSSRWDVLRTTIRAKSAPRGDLGVGGAGGGAYALASSVNNAVAAARGEEETQQVGATNQNSTRDRKRVVDTLSEHCDERTLEALSEMVREALAQRGTTETGGRSKHAMVRDPSFWRQSPSARGQFELEGVGTEGETVSDTSLNAVGITTGESKGYDDGDQATRGGGTKKYGSNSIEGARRTRAAANPSVANAVLERCVSLRSIDDLSAVGAVGDGTPERESFAEMDANLSLPVAGIAARNQEFFQQQRKEKERADAEAAQEKHAARSRLSPEARQEAEEAENAAEEHGRAKTHMLRTQMGMYKAAGGRGQGGPRGGGRGRGGRGRGRVDAIARRTSIVL